MSPDESFAPIYTLTRGGVVEALHYGAIVVVDISGRLVASHGDPQTITFLRSSAKPFQVLPFLTHGGKEFYNLTDQEIAIMCASHSGTDLHREVINQIQVKTGVAESELLCGVHMPIDETTAHDMLLRQEQSTPNRHNCSGKHTGMLAFVHMMEGRGHSTINNVPYIDPKHPIQQEIISTFADMCGVPVDTVSVGVDGCSAPIFALPLYNSALAYARLCDPRAGGVSPEARVLACEQITKAMVLHPDMVAGPERFDTLLMEVGRGRIVSKGGAEAFMGVGLMPGALGPGSPAMGIAGKIMDGGKRSSVAPAVMLEILRQLGVLSASDLKELSQFGPQLPVLNWRGLIVGEAFPTFKL